MPPVAVVVVWGLVHDARSHTAPGLPAGTRAGVPEVLGAFQVHTISTGPTHRDPILTQILRQHRHYAKTPPP